VLRSLAAAALRQMQMQDVRRLGPAEAVSYVFAASGPGPAWAESGRFAVIQPPFFFAGSPKRAHPPQIAMTKDLKDVLLWIALIGACAVVVAASFLL
jgi:hypothetical protein